jgi:hypothetical protein
MTILDKQVSDSHLISTQTSLAVSCYSVSITVFIAVKISIYPTISHDIQPHPSIFTSIYLKTHSLISIVTITTLF